MQLPPPLPTFTPLHPNCNSHSHHAISCHFLHFLVPLTPPPSLGHLSFLCLISTYFTSIIPIPPLPQSLFFCNMSLSLFLCAFTYTFFPRTTPPHLHPLLPIFSTPMYPSYQTSNESSTPVPPPLSPSSLCHYHHYYHHSTENVLSVIQTYSATTIEMKRTQPFSPVQFISAGPMKTPTPGYHIWQTTVAPYAGDSQSPKSDGVAYVTLLQFWVFYFFITSMAPTPPPDAFTAYV